MSLEDQMLLEIIILSKLNQSQKNRYRILYLVYSSKVFLYRHIKLGLYI